MNRVQSSSAYCFSLYLAWVSIVRCPLGGIRWSRLPRTECVFLEMTFFGSEVAD